MLVRHKSDEAFLDQGGKWDEEAGQKVIRFFESYLCLEDGRPFKVLPWMRDVIRSWYCWLTPENQRRTRIGLLTCGRKNAKSILTYGLTAYHLVADGVQSPSCASCAVNREQAAQIFDWFKFAIDNNPKLSKALHAIPSKKTILYPAKNGKYRSLASDTQGGNFGHGFTFLVHDELAFHKRDDLYTTLKNSTDARRGLQVITSTAGWNKNGAFYKLVQYSRKVLSGEIIDPTFQPWLFEIPEGADVEDENNWRLANPSIGVCQSAEDFRSQWEREKRDATTRLAFTRLKFNQWTDAENAWIPVESWDDCKSNVNLDGIPVVCGVDVGATRDLTAITLVGVLPDKQFAVKTWGFVPEGAFNTRDHCNHLQYQAFAKAGSLIVTPGTATDEQQLIGFLDDLRERYSIVGVVFDKWQSLTISNHCMRQGLLTYNFPQTHSYFNAPCIELERLVNNRKIAHDGCPLLRWQIGHTYLDRDHKGYVKPVTARPENKKDNLIALLMALSIALQVSPSSKPSIYQDRGLVIL